MDTQTTYGLNGPILRAAFGGACWSLPFAAFTMWQCLQYSKHFTTIDSVLTGVAVVLVWAAIASLVTWQRLREELRKELGQGPSPRERIIQDEVRRAARTATFLSTPVAFFFVVANWGYNPGAALLGAAMLQGIWVGSASCVGAIRGRLKARKHSSEDSVRSVDRG